MMKIFRRTRVYVSCVVTLTLFTLVLLTGCVSERSPITGQKNYYGMSWSQEEQVGKHGNAEITQQYGLYPDPNVQAYVRRVGQRVLSHSDLRKPGAPAEYRNTPFTFQVLNDPAVNAFALPGGYIYVTRGLMNHLENEAQLAVVLGHEIGHVAARHASKQTLHSEMGQAGVAAGALLGAAVLGAPEVASPLMNLGGTGLKLVTLKYSRRDEAQADELGVRYASQAGYDAAQAASFFETLKRISKQEGGSLPTFLSTHPDPGNREQRVVQLAANYRRSGQMLAVDRDSYLQHINGMFVGKAPHRGAAPLARIELVQVQSPAPFASFIPTSKVAGLSPEDMAILNQVRLTDPIPAGTILKIPRLAGSAPH